MEKIIVGFNVRCLFSFATFLVLIASIDSSTRADAPRGYPDPDLSAEQILLKKIGLPEDVNDSQIVDLLASPDKRHTAALIIRYKKIISATPKLLAIMSNVGIRDADKLMAAEALCDFGNKDWLPVIKAMAEDPNSQVSRSSLKYDMAGLLARAGDFSQFDVVVKGLSDEKDFVRSKAIRQLGKFASPTDPVTDTAVNLLSDIAKSDESLRLREYAIESLENLARVKLSIKEKVVEAIEANVDANDEYLRAILRGKLTAYKKAAEPNKPAQ